MKRCLFLVLVMIPLVGFGQPKKPDYRQEIDTVGMINNEVLIRIKSFKNDSLIKEFSSFYNPVLQKISKDWLNLRFRDRTVLWNKNKYHGPWKDFDKKGNIWIREFENGYFVKEYCINKEDKIISCEEFEGIRYNLHMLNGESYAIIKVKNQKNKPAKAEKQ